jgi:acetoin utilization deacetylase AcuC-like enzyme
MLVLSSTSFEEHVTPPGHPERVERAHVFDRVAAGWIAKGAIPAAPRAATREELARVHAAGYLEQIAASAGRAVMLDRDTFTSPESCDIALLAAGAAVQAAEHASEHGEPAFALVRPPGHHAERDRAMGFCIYNNVAVAAADALARGLDRVAVVDFDVHHGNGTQWMFYDSPRVLYVSTHQYPFYPGTGAADETGTGQGAGFTLNVPLEAGATDADYTLVYTDAVLPVLRRFAPQLVIVSAGFDAHERDPLGSMRMTAGGFAAIVRQLMGVAPRGAIAFVTEGGYDLAALAECLDASFAAIAGSSLDSTQSRLPPPGAAREGPSPVVAPDASARGERALRAVRAAQAPFWPGI